MGNFGGHALPGSFFIIFAVWSTVGQYRRYFLSLRKNGHPYRNTPTYKFFWLCGRLSTWEMEGFLKIFFTAVGFMLEIITGTKNGHFVYLGNGQHATMFFFFGMTGVLDILIHHGVPLPKNINYIAFVLSLLVEGILFKFHLHGRKDLDVLLHTLLVYTIFLNAVAILAEMRFKSSLLAGLIRSFFIFVQGTWFWQVGFILYNPFPGAQPWDQESHEQMMIATMIYAWHFGGVFIIMLLIGGVVACVCRCKGDLGQHGNSYDLLHMHLLPKTSDNGHTVLNVLPADGEDDSDSDIEYRRPIMPVNK